MHAMPTNARPPSSQPSAQVGPCDAAFSVWGVMVYVRMFSYYVYSYTYIYICSHIYSYVRV